LDNIFLSLLATYGGFKKNNKAQVLSYILMNSSKISKIIRIFILLAIMAISGYIMYQKSSNTAAKSPSPCSSCSKVSSCDLPDAKEFKGED
jgi:hypothetical protein